MVTIQVLVNVNYMNLWLIIFALTIIYSKTSITVDMMDVKEIILAVMLMVEAMFNVN